MRKSIAVFLAAAIIACAPTADAQAAEINLLPATTSVYAFGNSPTGGYYAQSFQALPGLAETLTFEMESYAFNPALGDTNFHLLITGVQSNTPTIAIENQSPIRPSTVLFESGNMTVGADAGWTTFSVNLGGLSLVPGQTYAWVLDAFVTSNGMAPAGASVAAVGGETDVYPDGQFFYFNVANNGNDRSEQFASSDWQNLSPSDHRDLAFQMTFIPEPSSLALATFGIVGLAAWRWRQHKR
jgi:hypothetical protein